MNTEVIHPGVNKLVARIQALIETAGPNTQKVLVAIGEKGKEGYKELGEFAFKRLCFKDMDLLRLHSLTDKGQFDKTLHAGANARLVAATLIDEDTGMNIFTVDDVDSWPAAYVDAFAMAANKVNSLNEGAAKNIEKNSDATVGEKA